MKKLLLLLVLSSFLGIPAYGLDINQGEIVNIWIAVTERDSAAFTIDSATYSVEDRSGTVLQDSAAATVNQTTHYVYGLVDTTSYSDDLFAQVKFIFVIGSETYIYYVPIHIFDYILGSGE